MSERNRVCARMPNGELVGTDAMRLTVKGVPTVALIAKCTVTHDLVDDPKYYVFNRGFKKNEWGLYLPKRMIWVFKRTYPDMQQFCCLLRDWHVAYLSGKRNALINMLEKMDNAETKKQAFSIRNAYYRKFGSWEFGFKRDSRTKGYDALMERAEEFNVNPEQEEFIPRIAWMI